MTTTTTMSSSWKKRIIWLAFGMGIAIACYLMLLGVGMAFAQSRQSPSAPSMGVGDIQSVLNGFRAFLGIASLLVPGLLLAYYTWKYRPKDAYEAAWLALGWCGLAYVLR